MKKLCCIFGLMLALFAGSSFALVPKISSLEYQAAGNNYSIGSGGYKPSINEACAAAAANYHNGSYVATSSGGSGGYCTITINPGGFIWNPMYSSQPVLVCPANSTVSGSSCACTPPAVEDGTHTSCVVPEPDVCAAGAGLVSTYNVTAGYSRSVSGAGLYPPLLPDGSASPAGYTGLPPETMCISGCKHSRGAIVDSWTSLEPTATGLYRQSDDWSFTSMATSCVPTASDTAALKPDAAVPACVGFLGQINGKTSCVASLGSANGITSTKPNLANVGNPMAGSAGGVGGIPSTGGNGANGGGPKGSSDGSVVVGGQVISGAGAAKPSGTTSAPAAGDVQAACGAPGQPRCAIDESGTSNGLGAIKSTDLEAQFDKLTPILDGIQTSSGKDTSWGLVPHWLQNSGGCQPSQVMEFPTKMNLPPLTLDICPLLPQIYTLMNLLWVATTFGIVIAMVLRVTT